MRFGAGDQLVDRGTGRVLGEPFGQRLRGQVGRAELAVKPPAHQRHGQHGDCGDQPCGSRGARRFLVRPAARGETQDAATDLGARFLGLARLDQAACHVAVKLGELVAVDFEVVIASSRHAFRAAGQRQKHRQAGAQCKDCGYDPEQHGYSNKGRALPCQHKHTATL